MKYSDHEKTNRGRILVVEDEELVREAMCSALENDAEFTVDCAADGREALEKLAGGPFDLVLLDIVLPDIDGFALAEQLRERATPFFMISTRSLPADAIAGFDAGAEEYLRKPVDSRELLVRVQHFLRQLERSTDAQGGESGSGPERETAAFHAAGLEIDPNAREVRIRGKTVGLTPIEAKILLLMARNTGRYVSTDRLIREIWGDDTPADGYQSMRVHIRRLRSKLEPDPSRPTLITNKWGAGYMLAPPKE